MTSLAHKVRGGWSVVLLLGAGLWWLDFVLATHFRAAALVSGIVLFGLILFLALFNARKKLPFLPLFKAAIWMKFHSLAGMLTVVAFLIHTNLRLPRGALEIALALLFWIVVLSGVLGLVLSRILPMRLTMHGENLIFERIPALREGIRQELEELAVSSVRRTNSSTIADFYEQRLRGYFERPAFPGRHLFGQKQPLHRLVSEIQALDRYVNAEERKILGEIEELVRAKDNLDYQWTVQGLLKLWLFVHIPLTYALILVAAVHGLLAWQLS